MRLRSLVRQPQTDLVVLRPAARPDSAWLQSFPPRPGSPQPPLKRRHRSQPLLVGSTACLVARSARFRFLNCQASSRPSPRCRNLRDRNPSMLFPPSLRWRLSRQTAPPNQQRPSAEEREQDYSTLSLRGVASKVCRRSLAMWWRWRRWMSKRMRGPCFRGRAERLAFARYSAEPEDSDCRL